MTDQPLSNSTLQQLRETFTSALTTVSSFAAWDALRLQYTGKNGVLTELLKGMKDLSPADRQTLGAALNELKSFMVDHLNTTKSALEEQAIVQKLAEERLDVTLPPLVKPMGKIHPVTFVVHELLNIFAAMGFQQVDGPDIEHEDLNFTQLNIPPLHPARSNHDTFYLNQLEPGWLLRTHTSPVQIRTLKETKGPLQIVSVGRTYRADWDATHTPMFHQLEGLYIGETIHMGHLRGCLTSFLQQFFQLETVPLRFRPSFFPFTEPSAEVDIGYRRHNGQLQIGDYPDWLEILGSGMIHPQVLKNCGLDPAVYQGFAFGVGVERLAMLKYAIPDLRAFYDSDMRWLQHLGHHACTLTTR